MNEQKSPPTDSSTFRFMMSSLMDPSPVPQGALYATVFRVGGASRRAIMTINRHNGDPAHPIGLFSDVLPKPKIQALAAAVDTIKWAELPPLTGGDPMGATLTLEYVDGPRIIRRVFNSRNFQFIRAIKPVMSVSDEIESALLQKPERAIDVSVIRAGAGFKMIWRNIGTGPVMLADPREPAGPAGSAPRAIANVVAIPPADGTFAPQPRGTDVALAAASGPLHPVTLPAGGSLELNTVPWTPPAPGTYSVHANWLDYVGPSVAPDAVMPMSPEPDQIHDKRPYVIRGAAFSPNHVFNVDKRR